MYMLPRFSMTKCWSFIPNTYLQRKAIPDSFSLEILLPYKKHLPLKKECFPCKIGDRRSLIHNYYKKGDYM